MMAKNPWLCLWSAMMLSLCLGHTMGLIQPSGCLPNKSVFVSENEIQAKCNEDTNINKQYYKAAPHYADKDTFLSKVYHKLTSLVVTGKVTEVYTRNYTNNLLVGKDTTRDICRVTQEFYMMDIAITCILKYEKVPNGQYFFPLPHPIFVKSTCPPRGVAVGDDVIVSVDGYSQDVFYSKGNYKPVNWEFWEFSFMRRDKKVLEEIMKSCGFQDAPMSTPRPNTCPPLLEGTKNCIDRENKGNIIAPQTVTLICSSVIYLLFRHAL